MGTQLVRSGGQTGVVIPEKPAACTTSLLPVSAVSPAVLADQLRAIGYLADEGLAAAAYLSLALGRPLLLEGEAGTGKTSLATALAQLLDAPLIRLQCYEGIDASQALYDRDFPRQLLHLRAAEAAGTGGGSTGTPSAGTPSAGAPGGVADRVKQLEGELYDRRFLLSRPLLAALETTPCVLLIDEVDRADDEFEAFLLEVLSEYSVSIPELGTIRAAVPPVVVLTSNRTRELHDALKRRCFYHWLPHPELEREVAILRSRLPEVSEKLARQVAVAAQALRAAELVKPPGVAETLDWARALRILGVDALDPASVAASLGAVLKYREDQDRAGEMDWIAVLAGV
jgi:MoxR-like ATPase